MVVTCGAELSKRTELVARVVAAVRGGVRLVQVRENDMADDALHKLVWRIITALHCESLHAQVLINNRPHVARALGLGLHLPENAAVSRQCNEFTDDAKKRHSMDSYPLWGQSVHSAQSWCAAGNAGAQYVVLGTVFPTASKPGYEGIGISGLKRVLSAGNRMASAISIERPGAERRVLPPVFAIGGMHADRIGAVIGAGAYGIASSRAILAADDVEKSANSFVQKVADAFINAQHLLSP